jgi:branched-chain amino acid transport system substrate-binding protein
LASALVISGPNVDLGLDSQFGVEIAIEFQGEILGHSIELQTLDDGCSPEGGQIAGQKIVSNPSIVAVIGSSCSGAAVPMSKVISDAGYVMVSPSNTAHTLTNPDYHEAGYLRTSHNDMLQGGIMAEYAYNVLGLRTAAAIHDGDLYTEGLAQAFVDSFEGFGGQIVDFVAVDKGDTDMLPALNRIAAAGPPAFLYYPVFTSEGSFLTIQAREIAALDDTILAAADGLINQAFIDSVVEAGEGMYFSGPDLSFPGELYDNFIAKYVEKYGSEPISVFHAHAFDAANMIFACIEQVAVQEDEGTIQIGRQAMRDCLFATQDFQGLTGLLTCDQYGDCGAGEFIVSQLQDGEFERIWP